MQGRIGRIEKLAAVVFSGQGVKLGGVGALGSNVQASDERRLAVDWARGVVIVNVKVPRTADKPARWVTRYFPLSGGDVAHLDPGDQPGPLDLDGLLLTPLERVAQEIGQGKTLAGALEQSGLQVDPGRGINMSATQVPELRASMTAGELERRIPADSLRILAREGYVGYGDEPGPAGPWKTYDGKPMPTWAQQTADGNAVGALTVRRWEVGALHVLEAALGLGLLEGVGFRPADAQVPAELVHFSKAPNDARTGYRAMRLDQLTPDERARVRRCIDGALWLPFQVPSTAAQLGHVDRWEVAPLEYRALPIPDLGIRTGPDEQEEAERLASEQDARPASVLDTVEALLDAGYEVSAAQVKGWADDAREAAYRFALNEANGDAGPIPEHVKGLPPVKPGPASRAPDRRPARVGADTLNPDELVHVAATPASAGGLEVPATTVRVADMAPEQRAQLVRHGDGSLHYAPPAEQPPAPAAAATAPAAGSAAPPKPRSPRK